jgi:hypothetical protein
MLVRHERAPRQPRTPSRPIPVPLARSLKMKSISRKLVLGAALAAGAVFLTFGSVQSMAGGVASVAPLQADVAASDGPLVLAKDFKCCGKGGGGGIPPGPGGFKGGGGGGGGGGGKGGKGGGGGSGWGPVIGGAIVLGLAHCAVQSERCEDIYGDDNERYRRCMRRAGC